MAGTTITSSQYPLFFKNACDSFFGLKKEQEHEQEKEENNKLDDYWNISPLEIYKGLFKAFNYDYEQFIPDIISVTKNKPLIDFINQRKQNLQKSPIQPECVCLETKIKDLKPYKNVAFTGEMHHGKSTCAEYLCCKHGYVEYTFSGPLKTGVMELFDFSYEQTYGEEKDQIDQFWGVSPRYLLQQIGTNLFRNKLKIYLPNLMLQKSLWVDNFFKWFNKTGSYTNFVVSDCRFPDEAQAIKESNIKLYRVVRPSLQQNNSQHQQQSPNIKHASEFLQKNIIVDCEIINDGTKEELYDKVQKLVFS